ncbi:MAG TPA: phosphoadenylyl-sulfate reductase [Flavisolibacter sp.]|nr:phosphoadenylyl-sulfate reductase [Flavisolibacter sp.]
MSILSKGSILSLQNDISRLSITDALKKLHDAFPDRITFSTSFSYEDQVITDYISKSAPVTIFTLDTGRLFPETYSTWTRTLERYKLPIKAFYPDKKQLQSFVTNHGPNAFYESVDLRQKCCYIRKVVPLKKALEGKAVWITGLRAQHSPNRNDMQVVEWDDANQIIKYNPLLHWSTEEVRKYIDQHNIPYNSLHDKGFVSIGCAPCTRAIRPGEDFRAGRWWWEDASKKECGLHVHQIVSK